MSLIVGWRGALRSCEGVVPIIDPRSRLSSVPLRNDIVMCPWILGPLVSLDVLICPIKSVYTGQHMHICGLCGYRMLPLELSPPIIH